MEKADESEGTSLNACSLFYPPLTGSKTPTSRFKINEKDKWWMKENRH